MKLLILNGSPRKKGDTAMLIERLIECFQGQAQVLDAYDMDIKGCIDCRWCWTQEGCAIQDGMQKCYQSIQESDLIVIASPVYFSELTGPLLTVASRLQCFYTNRVFRGRKPVAKRKKGAVLLCGGGDGSPDKALETAKCLLKQMNAVFDGAVMSLNTNKTPAGQDTVALCAVKQLAEKWNKGMTER